MQKQYFTSTLLKSALTTGSPSPDLVLPTVTGKRVSLYEILHRGAAFVSFYWSDRCSYHDLGLLQLKRALPVFQTLLKTIVLVSPQPPENFFWMTADSPLNCIVLQDSDRSSLKTFGFVDQSDRTTRPGFDHTESSQSVVPTFRQAISSLPTHATYVIAQDKTILYSCVESHDNPCSNLRDCMTILDSEYWLGMI